MRQPAVTDLPAYPDRESACGFCIDRTPRGVRHDLCPGEIHTAEGKANDKVWTCKCWKERHPS